jgi:predicted component of type VI protein secretion system
MPPALGKNTRYNHAGARHIGIPMSNPLVQAFFVGRAVADILSEQFEATMTQTLSDLGRFDAEQRERLRQFTEDVLERAQQTEAAAMGDRPTDPTPANTASTPSTPTDLQSMLDELRAEIAQLRSSLQRYRSSAS